MLDQRTQGVAVGRDQHGLPSPQIRHDGVVPVRQHPHNDVTQALGCRYRVRRQARVPLIHSAGLVRPDRWWWRVVGTAPEHELLLAVLLERLSLVETLQAPVMALIETP